jgi:hypothetical protein
LARDEWITRGWGERQRTREEDGKEEKGKDSLDIYNLNPTGKAVLTNVFQNGFSYIRKTDPPKESEPSSKEPEP